MNRKLTGIIVSDKMNQTAVVAVSHTKKHARYEKYIKITKKFKAHNEGNQYKAGEKVVIQETRPMSKEKYFKIIGRVEQQANNPTL